MYEVRVLVVRSPDPSHLVQQLAKSDSLHTLEHAPEQRAVLFAIDGADIEPAVEGIERDREGALPVSVHGARLAPGLEQECMAVAERCDEATKKAEQISPRDPLIRYGVEDL